MSPPDRTRHEGPAQALASDSLASRSTANRTPRLRRGSSLDTYLEGRERVLGEMPARLPGDPVVAAQRLAEVLGPTDARRWARALVAELGGVDVVPAPLVIALAGVPELAERIGVASSEERVAALRSIEARVVAVVARLQGDGS